LRGSFKGIRSVRPAGDFCFISNPSHRQAWLGIFIKQKSPRIRGGTDLMPLAEKEGFEPPVPWIQDNGFQDRRIRPLCHFSILAISPTFIKNSNRRKDNIFLILHIFRQYIP
jgi:hypothetical protein